jgi:hypothetical protein
VQTLVRISLQPFGTDPAFSPRSSLFKVDNALNLGGWYNTSSAKEVNAKGSPYGFFPVQLQGNLCQDKHLVSLHGC